MNQQEDGWPLGLQPLNMRDALEGNRNFSGSISFNTLLTGSPSSLTDSSSSDLDTESTGSFFHDKSVTFGSLIGVSSILELSGRSVRGRRVNNTRVEKSYRSKTWLFSLCSRGDAYTERVKTPPSLGHFLEMERRAANNYGRNQSLIIFEPNEFADAQPVSEPNALFVNGHVAPPQSRAWSGSNTCVRSNRSCDQFGGCGVPVLFSCLCGQTSN